MNSHQRRVERRKQKCEYSEKVKTILEAMAEFTQFQGATPIAIYSNMIKAWDHIQDNWLLSPELKAEVQAIIGR